MCCTFCPPSADGKDLLWYTKMLFLLQQQQRTLRLHRSWEVLFLSPDGQLEVPKEVCVVHQDVNTLCLRVAQTGPCRAEPCAVSHTGWLLARGPGWAGCVGRVGAGRISISMLQICHQHLSQTMQTHFIKVWITPKATAPCSLG